MCEEKELRTLTMPYFGQLVFRHRHFITGAAGTPPPPHHIHPKETSQRSALPSMRNKKTLYAEFAITHTYTLRASPWVDARVMADKLTESLPLCKKKKPSRGWGRSMMMESGKSAINLWRILTHSKVTKSKATSSDTLFLHLLQSLGREVLTTSVYYE